MTSPPPHPRRGPLGWIMLILLGIFGFLAGVATGGYVYSEELIRWVMRGELARLAQQGTLVRVEHVAVRGLSGVALQGVHVQPGPAPDAPRDMPFSPALRLDVEAIQLTWSGAALRSGRLELSSVGLIGPQLTVDTRRGVEPILRDLRRLEQLVAARGAAVPSTASPSSSAGPRRTRPLLLVTGGQVRLVGLGLGLQQVGLRFQPAGPDEPRQILEGSFAPEGFVGGPCAFVGQLGPELQEGGVQVDCQTPLQVARGSVAMVAGSLRLELGGGTSLLAPEDRLRLQLAPLLAQNEQRLSVLLPALQVVAPVPGDPQPRPRLTGAVRTVLSGGAALGIEAKLTTPPAGSIVVAGQLDPYKRQAALDLRITGLDLASSPLPALLPGNLESGQVQANVAVDLVEQGRRLDLIGQVQVRELSYFHPGLARDPVQLAQLEADFDLTLDLRERRLESAASVVQVNRVPITVDGALHLGHDRPVVKLKMHTGEIAATDLVASFPAALISRLRPSGVRGTASFGANLELNLARPEELKLTIQADVGRLEVESLGGGIRLDNLARPFTHTWEDEERRELYQLETGPGAPSWVDLHEVPEILRIALFAQEDGGFMWHKGFSLLHVKGSLVQNIQEGRFARGASTLTMQLARNLFLGREKLLSRKLQEVILAWRLEQELTKEGILSLYLNIIEWGIGVFGIKAAADHYFGKHPAQLTLAESIFLVSIIPRPRAADRAFLAGRLNRNQSGRIRWMLQLLKQRGHLDDVRFQTALGEELAFRDPATASALQNLWETVPHRRGAHQVTPSYQEEEPEEGPALPPPPGPLPAAGSGAPEP